jgi:hypothetical protein
MPKWLVIAAVVAVVVLVVLMSWLHRRSLESGQPNPPAALAPASAPVNPPAQQQAPAAPAQPQGPVVLTATAPAWIQVTDQGKTLYQGELQPGQSYTVPATASAPLLKAGKPEALRVTVGSAVAPPVGPAGKVASHVSLKGTDLLRGGGQTAAPSPPAPQPAANAPVQ